MVGSTMQQEVEAIPGGKGAERYTAWQVVLCLLYIVHRTSYIVPTSIVRPAASNEPLARVLQHFPVRWSGQRP